MATAASTEELREAVLLCFGAGTLVFLIAQLCWAIVSLPVEFYCEKDLALDDLLDSLLLLLAGASHAARNSSKNGQRDRPAA